MLRGTPRPCADGARSRSTRRKPVSVAALVVALVLATVIALWLTRSISGPVEALERGMRAVADGELDHQLDLSTNRRDEFGRLAHELPA